MDFDPRAHVLDVEFAGGAVYRYFGVPTSVFRRVMEAESKGRFINAHVRDCYPFKRLPRAKS